jgi:Phage terminase large subunit (GpA)
MAKDETFNLFKEKILSLDACWWCEKYLTLDGKPFRLRGNGYRPFADIYRYISIKALEPDSLPVLLVKGRQVGGTTMAAALEMYFVGCGLFGANGKPPVRIIHAFPQKEMAEKFSKEKLQPLISSSLPMGDPNKVRNVKSYMQTLMDRSSDTGDSLGFKLFQNGNFLRIDSTGLSGERLRGGTADMIFYDEVQDISADAIGNTVEMLKQAKHGRIPGGVQVYFGTPKRKGSDFYKMWNVSSQQYYYLGCEKCKEYFPLYTPDSNDWEKIWLRGFIVKCTHCGCEQDKNEAAERGKWIATKDISDPSVRYVGFHINQFYMPHISREAIEAERPGIHPTTTMRKFQNEVLGEFFQGDASPITSEEIIKECGDRDRGVRARIKPGEEQLVVLGIDYGSRSDLEQLADPSKGRQGMSYTTAVVMSVKGPNLFNIDLALKFPKNDPESKKGLIDMMMRQYSVDLAVGDIGYSNDFSHTLHTIYGDQ